MAIEESFVSFQRKLESTFPVQSMDSSFRWNDTWRVRILCTFVFFSEPKKRGDYPEPSIYELPDIWKSTMILDRILTLKLRWNNYMPQLPTLELPIPGEKLLLHSCCAPCSGEVMERLLAAKIDYTIFFYNPNIHPVERIFTSQK